MKPILNRADETTQASHPDCKTVVLWGREELLVEAVECLLARKSNWHVIRILTEWDSETLMHEFQNMIPDVLIVSESVVVTDGERLIQVVEEYPTLKIITINLDNNLIGIYHKQTLGIKDASDLLEIIEAVTPTLQGGTTEPLKSMPARSFQLVK